jgi:hypothetical protein
MYRRGVLHHHRAGKKEAAATRHLCQPPLLLGKPNGIAESLQSRRCYRHNLAEPEGGPRTRWAQKMNTINLRIGSYMGVWRAKSAMYLV